MNQLRDALQKFVDEGSLDVKHTEASPDDIINIQTGFAAAKVHCRKLLEEIPPNGLPDEAVCFFRDGDMMCCVYGDFINLQESPAGFAKTFDEAMDALQADAVKPPTKTAGAAKRPTVQEIVNPPFDYYY